MTARARTLALLLFGSGFCALIYQTTWLREFRLIFGASTAASAAVLGIFMLGIGLGGIYLGRRSEQKTQPLTFYGRLELFIALSAALSLLLIWFARHLYIAIGGTQAVGLAFGTVIRLLLATIIIGVPTFLMGGTLPAAARAAVPSDDLARRAIGILYGTNTLGAVAGALAGTFYFFESLGNHLTLLLAAGVNLLLALVAIRLGSAVSGSETKKSRGQKTADFSAPAKINPAFVYAAALLVGFTFFLMELVWYRMLAPLIGGSTFSFGLILAFALLGIGIGGAFYAVLGARRMPSVQLFAITCALEALFVGVPYALGDRIAVIAMLLRPLGTIGFYGHVAAWSALCAIVIFPAAFISGVQFPLLIALLGKGRTSVGVQTGHAYAWNTIGALLGSLAGGFGFMPIFSAPGLWRGVVVTLGLLAVLAAMLARTGVRTLLPLGFAVLALTTIFARGPTAFWRHSQIGVGRLARFQASPNELHELIDSSRRSVVWERDGVESGVALTKQDGLAFIVNGKSDGNAVSDAGTQIMCGLIGAAFLPNPTKAMVVGLGTGSTAGWLAAIPNFDRVDVVELEPAVVKVAEACTAVNHNALQNPKLHLTIGDAREGLLTTREHYDLIMSEPSNPYRAGIAGLFTREFYESVNRRLNPGGIFLQWIQVYDVDDRTIATFYRTLGSVFVHIDSWQTESGDLLLMATHEPITCDIESLQQKLAEEPFRSAIAVAWRGASVEDFLAHFVGNAQLEKALPQMSLGPLNTDDRTVIEFALARNVGLMNGFNYGNVFAAAQRAGVDRPESIRGDVDWSRVKEARLAMDARLNRADGFLGGLDEGEKQRATAFADFSSGDLPAALRDWQEQSAAPGSPSQLAMIAECLAANGDEAALPLIAKLNDVLPQDARAIRAEFLWRTQHPQEAIEELRTFFQELHETPWADSDLIKRTLLRAEALAKSDRSRIAAAMLLESISSPFAVFVNETDRVQSALRLAEYADGDQPSRYTFSALEAFEPYPLWQRDALLTRKNCYEALHDPRAGKAARDLDSYLKYEPATGDLHAVSAAISEER